MPIFQVEQEEIKPDYGRFVIEPLEQGYGNTLATALRRVLLTGLPGAAITQVRIAGMKHQFAPLKGVGEDGVELLLNLKRVRLAYKGEKPAKLSLSAHGKGPVTAGQIKAPPEVTIANPDIVIATLADSRSKLDVEMQVESGVGYSPSEDRRTPTVGLIPLDADFSPVKRVSSRIEETRVGRLTNYDKLTLEVWTDGSITADSAIKTAAEILVDYLNNIISPIATTKPAAAAAAGQAQDIERVSVEELNLPTRITNALVGAGFETVADIVKAGRSQLAKVRNLGGKSVKVIDVALAEKGIASPWEEE